MKYSNFSRALAFVLVLVMVLSMAPATVFASDSAVYSQITAADELTPGMQTYGFIYNLSEVNSVSVIEQCKAYLDA